MPSHRIDDKLLVGAQVGVNVEAIIATVAALAALASAGFAYVVSRQGKRALLLAERQEARRRPSLVLYLSEGYVRHFGGEAAYRLYAFLLSISNPSDIANSVARIDLYVTYTTKQSLRMTIKVECKPFQSVEFGDAQNSLSTPFALSSHETSAGWAYFRVEEELLNDSVIDGYSVVATDSHGIPTGIESVIVRELEDEVQKT